MLYKVNYKVRCQDSGKLQGEGIAYTPLSTQKIESAINESISPKKCIVMKIERIKGDIIT